MKVILKDLGILKHAEFEVGDLTVICGANNTGKTYATYALYGFLAFWNESFFHNFLEEGDLEKLMRQGSVTIGLEGIKEVAFNIIDIACEEYTQNLPMVFGAGRKHYSTSSFKVFLDGVDFDKIDRKVQTKGPDGRILCEIGKVGDEALLSINITANADEVSTINKDWFLYQINRDIQCILFGKTFPEPFIASIERTGAAMFQKELDIYRNRLLEHVSNREKDINSFELLNVFSNGISDGRYALPVRRDVDFIRDLENEAKRESVIAENNRDILMCFDVLAGGEYKSTREGVYYTPDKSKVKLTMGESASSVRSLLNLGMYIRHCAKPGDFLMIDEPELNLHPKNQRLMARLLAKMVNAGIRVFITTHSDYILKEFNALIMMKNAGSNASHIMEKHGYEENELLDATRVKAYIAKKELMKIEGQSKRQKFNTLIKAPIGFQGIEVTEFDDTINIMNEVQEELLLIEEA